ncbi:MAG: DUF2254 domain-containing protein [Nitrosopumilus sp.]|nr:DUF2254 domain-containing protein [Nitrosopumilus sp.]
MAAGKSQSVLLEEVARLVDDGVGDSSRLFAIKKNLEKGIPLPDTEKNYVLQLLTSDPGTEQAGESPPVIFRRQNLWAWGTIVFMTFLVMWWTQFVGYYPPPISFTIESDNPANITEGAKGLLYTNAQILATMLTVTLGITLLGMQFRAQSYSLIGMMDYMNDKVVYGFTAVFVIGTIFSIIAAGAPKEMIDWMVIYAITGTIFSFFYQAGYIYHLVYKLQVPQMLEDNYKKMKKSAKTISSKESLDTTHYDPFDIWEGIMKRTIETGNSEMFENGLKKIYYIINKETSNTDSDDCKETSNTDSDDCKETSNTDSDGYNETIFKSKYSKYLLSIWHSCLEHKQYQLIEAYVDKALLEYLILLESNKSFKDKWIIDIIEDLELTMYNIIDENEYETYNNCLSKIITTMWPNKIMTVYVTDEKTEKKTIVDKHRVIQLSNFIKKVIMYGTSKNSNITSMFVTKLLKESNTDKSCRTNIFIIRSSITVSSDNIKSTTSNKRKIFYADIDTIGYWNNRLKDILEQILTNAAEHNDKFTCLNSIRALLKLGAMYEESLPVEESKPLPGDSTIYLHSSDTMKKINKLNDEKRRCNNINEKIEPKRQVHKVKPSFTKKDIEDFLKSDIQKLNDHDHSIRKDALDPRILIYVSDEFIRLNNQIDFSESSYDHPYDHFSAFILLHRLIQSLISNHKYSVLEYLLTSFVDEENDMYANEMIGGDYKNNLGLRDAIRTMLWNNFEIIIQSSINDYNPEMFKSVSNAKISALKSIMVVDDEKAEEPQDVLNLLDVDMIYMKYQLASIEKLDNHSRSLLFDWCQDIIKFLELKFSDYRNIELSLYIHAILKKTHSDFVRSVIDQIEFPPDSTEPEKKVFIKKYTEMLLIPKLKNLRDSTKPVKYSKIFNITTEDENKRLKPVYTYMNLKLECTKYFGFYIYAMAVLKSESGYYENAMHYIDRALTSTINLDERMKLYMLAGKIRSKQKQYDDAKSWYCRVLDIEPENTLAQHAIDELKCQQNL